MHGKSKSMHSEQQIETELKKGMRRIGAPYQMALKILRSYATSEDCDIQEITLQLRPSMDLIAECERSLAPFREQWNQLQTTAHGELAQLIEGQSILLKELIERLNVVENRMATSRKHLASRLDVTQRQNAMRQAYQA
jgi:hypothetical protein